MEQETYRTTLAAVQKICAEKGEADAADIAKAVGLSSAAAEAYIRQMEEDSFADVIEIDLCCGEEYIVKGLTEQGRAFLGEI